VQNAQAPDIFWTGIDWAVRGAGAILLLILSVGWKDYRDKMGRIPVLETEIAVLKKEIENLKESLRHDR
jgi:hypothetical protein